MPDITMCASSECPLAQRCYRSPESGTEPSEFRQSWSAYTWVQDNEGQVYCRSYAPLWAMRAEKGGNDAARP